MKVLHEVKELREALNTHRLQGQRIGLVPTMGNLHQGHLKLVEAAQTQCDIVLVSIFVNPMQFGPNEDFEDYPRTLEQDNKKLQNHHVNYVFAPQTRVLYPDGLTNQTTVHVYGVSEGMCGLGRPGHFEGVATVVSKLFNIAQPDQAFFGEKDYQQVAVIKQMAKDLCFPVRIIPVPTVREQDGLALSSRNQYLNPEQRRTAPQFYATLKDVREQVRLQPQAAHKILAQALDTLRGYGFEPEYLELRRAEDLKMPFPEDTALVILGAVKIGKTRLIDNIQLTLNVARV